MRGDPLKRIPRGGQSVGIVQPPQQRAHLPHGSINLSTRRSGDIDPGGPAWGSSASGVRDPAQPAQKGAQHCETGDYNVFVIDQMKKKTAIAQHPPRAQSASEYSALTAKITPISMMMLFLSWIAERATGEARGQGMGRAWWGQQLAGVFVGSFGSLRASYILLSGRRRAEGSDREFASS